MKAITLRSGKELQPSKKSAPILNTEERNEGEKEQEHIEKQVEDKEEKQDANKKEFLPPLKPYEPPVPFP